MQAKKRTKIAKRRSAAGRKAASVRWPKGAQKQKLADALGISRMSLWTYELPASDSRHRPMPESMRKKYERLVKRG